MSLVQFLVIALLLVTKISAATTSDCSVGSIKGCEIVGVGVEAVHVFKKFVSVSGGVDIGSKNVVFSGGVNFSSHSIISVHANSISNGYIKVQDSQLASCVELNGALIVNVEEPSPITTEISKNLVIFSAPCIRISKSFHFRIENSNDACVVERTSTLKGFGVKIRCTPDKLTDEVHLYIAVHSFSPTALQLSYFNTYFSTLFGISTDFFERNVGQRRNRECCDSYN